MNKALCIIFLCVGIIIGNLITDVPFLTLKPEVSVAEIGNLIIAIIVAIAIPLFLTKWMDNERHLKNFLIEEIRQCINSIEPIKLKINQCLKNGATSPSEKQDINFYFKEVDIKIQCLREQLDLSFKKKGNELYTQVFNEYIKYWRSVTDGELMNDNFSIDERFYKEHNIAYAHFESFLKKSIHIINNF